MEEVFDNDVIKCLQKQLILSVMLLIGLHLDVWMQIILINIEWSDMIVIGVFLLSAIISKLVLPAATWAYYMKRQVTLTIPVLMLCIFKHYVQHAAEWNDYYCAQMILQKYNIKTGY